MGRVELNRKIKGINSHKGDIIIDADGDIMIVIDDDKCVNLESGTSYDLSNISIVEIFSNPKIIIE